MTLMLPEIEFEEIPCNDVGGVAFLTDASFQILGFCRYDFLRAAPMAETLKSLKYKRKDLSKNAYLFTPPPLPRPANSISIPYTV